MMRELIRALALAGALLFPAAAPAQVGAQPAGQPVAAPAPAPGGGLTKSQTAGSSGGGKSISVTPAAGALDYALWEQLAQRAERSVAEGTTSNSGLELLRGQLVDWRAKLQAAQNTNAGRIKSLRDQVTALGPAPADGASEAPELADRRKQLGEQLATLEAPGRAAEEAYRRANGLIAEIDAELRERQTAQLLKLWPTPANPANWATALGAVRDGAMQIWGEVAGNWKREARRTEMLDNLPGIGILLAMALVLIARGRRWIERFADWLQTSSRSPRWRRVWAFVASLGQIAVPAAGVFMVSVALMLTEMVTGMGRDLVLALPVAGFALFFSYWLAGRIFPKDDAGPGPLGVAPEYRAEGRFHTTMLGLVQGLEVLRQQILPPARLPEAAVPVLSLPLLLVMSLLLWRLGHLLNSKIAGAAPAASEGEGPGFRDRVLQILGKLVIGIAVLGPLLAVIGYTSAANALVFPAAASLGLAGLLVVLVQFLSDIYRAVIRAEADGQEDGLLLPVLAGFLLTIASLPLFALIWGARVEDLGELWNRFTEGFTVGETRISPSNFVYFLVLFVIGFGVTRLFQGALKSSILPKTRLDQGGRNAIVSGTGYVGIFLSALVAVSAAGIDLSGLAIVASALSVGIGFGLQNIVQNFVSGIILLIERPVSEGDWIEVGTVSGTVKAISVRSTRIQTFDRSDIIVPNADLVSQRVTNWTRFSLTGRVIVPVSVKFASDSRQVSRILQDIAEAQPLALLNPPPAIAFTGMGTDALNFEIRMLIRDVNFSTQVRTEVNHQIMQRFHEAGIALAGTPGTSPSRIEDIATVLEVLQVATPEQLARMAPSHAAAAEAAPPAVPPPAPPGDAHDDETER